MTLAPQITFMNTKCSTCGVELQRQLKQDVKFKCFECKRKEMKTYYHRKKHLTNKTEYDTL